MNYIEYFTNYVKYNYDINNDLVQNKYYHSLRVAKLMLLLSKKLNLNEEETILAFKLGLCHDLGRFHEVEINGKFNNKTFDHGSYSNKILYNDKFVNYMDIDNHLLFRKAIYCHNKKELASNLNYQEAFYANLLRDADKIDIIGMRSQGRPLDFIYEPTKEVINNYLNNEAIDIRDINNKTDSTILYLSFIKNLVFDASYDFIIESDNVENLISIINISDNNNDLFNLVLEKIYERRGKVYVR